MRWVPSRIAGRIGTTSSSSNVFSTAQRSSFFNLPAPYVTTEYPKEMTVGPSSPMKASAASCGRGRPKTYRRPQLSGPTLRAAKPKSLARRSGVGFRTSHFGIKENQLAQWCHLPSRSSIQASVWRSGRMLSRQVSPASLKDSDRRAGDVHLVQRRFDMDDILERRPSDQSRALADQFVA